MFSYLPFALVYNSSLKDPQNITPKMALHSLATPSPQEAGQQNTKTRLLECQMEKGMPKQGAFPWQGRACDCEGYSVTTRFCAYTSLTEHLLEGIP